MTGIVQITLSMSLDGFITGPDPDQRQPLGAGGADLLRPGGTPELVEEVLAATGATVVGRAMYDHVDGWGDEPPFTMPVFVVTHRHHEVRVAGRTNFTFVGDVGTAVAQAKVAAGEKNVYIGGGASIADQALRLGLVDVLDLHIEPVLLGGGTRLFADIGGEPIALERTNLVEGEPTTHLRFRVSR
ncbi:MAG TPA: dihydrofolate reductase family protein [Pseudonocardia sp.]|jgi:dihydrofolate reductase